jgi:predicted CXXCH cytochrome family protein
MPRRGWRIGLMVAALWAPAARGEEAQGTAAARARGGYEEACDLARVSDRSKASSLRCVACHDGTTGAESVFVMGRDARGRSMSHPVEVEYARARLRDGGRYVAEQLLPPDVPLVDGKVACTSCHDPASPLSKHVVDPARLCYACHRL